MTTTDVIDSPFPTRTPNSTTATYRPQSWALARSGLRCLLTYVIGPFLLPVTGAFVVPSLGIAASLLAIVLDLRAARRVRRLPHARAAAMAALYCGLTAIVTVMLVIDAWRLAR